MTKEKATHSDYMHPNHIRVETGEQYLCYRGGSYFYTNALCVAPNSDMHKRHNKKGLPKWKS